MYIYYIYSILVILHYLYLICMYKCINDFTNIRFFFQPLFSLYYPNQHCKGCVLSL